MQKLLFFFFTFSLLSFFGFAKANTTQPIKLSLEEAILLAIRTNPNVQSTQLSHLVERFNLYVQEWQFHPHYALQASASYLQKTFPHLPKMGAQSYSLQPSVSLLTPIGTELTLTSVNQKTVHFNPSLSLEISQPLMRGFGRAIVEAALNNARDSEVIARLNVEGVLRNTVSAVVEAYLGIVMAERTVIIDEDAVKRAEKSVEQTKLFIKAGHKAGNELVTVEANVASAKSHLENDRNNLLQARYALLAAIGIDPNTNVRFTDLDIHALTQKYRLPTLTKTKELSLQNDIQYQIDNIILHGATKRQLMVAQDNTRWSLNLTGSLVTGNGQGGGENNNLNHAFDLRNQAQAVGLALQIPIDDQPSKQALMNAKIALKQAELAFMQEKWSKETNAINGWNLVGSAERALRFAADAQKLQEKTYHLSFQKYLHGLIDSLELQTAQLQLIEAQQIMLGAEIAYIKALVDLDLLIGHTLNTWNIKTRL